MSTTGLDSTIHYANDAFIEVSGFTRDEIIGQPHNMVRHPDMPKQAFEDMWRTLRGGESWTALVKNRRKNGDHYWVRANVTPMRRGGAVVGYMSVRTRPERHEVAAAEALYQRFREGRAQGLAFHKGIVVRSGLLGWTSVLRVVHMHTRVLAIALACAALNSVGAWLTGVSMGQWATLSLVAIASSLVGFFLLRRQLLAPLRRVLHQAQAVASGQPETLVNMHRTDEVGMLMRAVNQAGLNLRSLVDDIARRAHGVGSGSAEMAHGNNDLSRRTESQASTLEETASAMEEFNATVRTNADNSRQANEFAQAATETASEGGRVVREVVAMMDDINTSSRKIEAIIGVIETIAFQTNLLALNAAVEAARAGEQGKGFAVVASEVRGLAGRAASAAKEINHLIHESVERVGRGSSLAGQAGLTMDRVLTSISGVAVLVNDIAVASREQSQGLQEVAKAIVSMDNVTQQNAALVEEMAAASTSLKHEAQSLVEAISVFRDEAATRLAPAEAPVRPPTTPLRGAGIHVDAGINLDSAIQVHVDWRKKLREAITQQAKLDVDTIRRDDCCAMGKWLHGDGQRRHGAQPVFVELIDAHKDFHVEAGQVAQCINQGAYPQATAMLSEGTAFADATSQVTRLITLLRNQRKKGSTKAAMLSISAISYDDPASSKSRSTAGEEQWETF